MFVRPERARSRVKYRSMRRASERCEAACGENSVDKITMATSCRHIHTYIHRVESSRVESLSFHNIEAENSPRFESIPRRLTLSGRRISIAIAMHCVLPKQIRGDLRTAATFSSNFLRKESEELKIRSKFVSSISVMLDTLFLNMKIRKSRNIIENEYKVSKVDCDLIELILSLQLLYIKLMKEILLI